MESLPGKTIRYLKIINSSSKTDKKSIKGALKLAMPKMPEMI